MRNLFVFYLLFASYISLAKDQSYYQWLEGQLKSYSNHLEAQVDLYLPQNSYGESTLLAFENLIPVLVELRYKANALTSCYGTKGFNCPLSWIDELKVDISRLEQKEAALYLAYPLLAQKDILEYSEESVSKIFNTTGNYDLNEVRKLIAKASRDQISKIYDQLASLLSLRSTLTQTTLALTNKTGSNKSKVLKRRALKNTLYKYQDILSGMFFRASLDPSFLESVNGRKLLSQLTVFSLRKKNLDFAKEAFLFVAPFALGPVGFVYRFWLLEKTGRYLRLLNRRFPMGKKSKSKWKDDEPIILGPDPNPIDPQVLINNSREVIKAVNARNRILSQIEGRTPMNHYRGNY